MPDRVNYYRLLHVRPDAPAEIIKASYRTLIHTLRRHPDLGGEHGQAALLNEAYSVLSDPSKRRAYDERFWKVRMASQSANRLVLTGLNSGREPGMQSVYQNVEVCSGVAIPGFCLFCGTIQRGLSSWCVRCRSPLKRPYQVPMEPDGRRRVERILRPGDVRFFSSWPSPGHSGRLADMSPRGARFLSDVPAEVNQSDISHISP